MYNDNKDSPKPASPIFSVSELNQFAQLVLEREIGSISVHGEISNLATPSSGHIYFSLKDEKSQIRCAMFRNKPGAKGFHPKNGLEVIASGLTSIYPIRGDYQLIVDSLELSGDGVLRAKFEALKQKLEKAGLFEEHNKMPIPLWPTKIGIITSPTGAAIQDIVTVIKRRCPTMPAIIYPCSVQGQNAADKIAQSIYVANKRNECDVLILARGGGSLEDLWSFNEEVVAQAIYDSKLPIVSGIGHEIDLTISDLVADLRAATPSAAAELTTPDAAVAIDQILSLLKRLRGAAKLQVNFKSGRVSTLAAKIKHPRKDLELRFQQTDDLLKQLMRKIDFQIQVRKINHQNLLSRLRRSNPETLYLKNRDKINNLEKFLKDLVRQKYRENQTKSRHLINSLSNLGHQRTLSRGYAIVRNENGTIIKNSNELSLNQTIKTTFDLGQATSVVKNIGSQ